MEITVKQEKDVIIYELNGRLDMSGSQQASDTIIDAIGPNQKIILDMTMCDYVASSGLRILLLAAKRGSMEKSKIVLAGMQPMVADVIAMTGFESLLESYSSREDALKALDRNGGANC
ncbi:MAG: STAS domain-containing protein [Treponema sp.]|jgi:anti-anti-sigma factor|nr:STAS domain-containing protein [Treponema sp.]